MIRTRGSGEIRLVAAITSRRCSHVVIVFVALDAGQCRMSSRKSPVCVQRVIEGNCRPGRRIVACIAGRLESRRRVRRIVGPSPIRRMAAVANSRQSGVVVVHMAGCTGYRRMRSGQWEDRRMVEGR